MKTVNFDENSDRSSGIRSEWLLKTRKPHQDGFVDEGGEHLGLEKGRQERQMGADLKKQPVSL
jgi:hypothetical protein